MKNQNSLKWIIKNSKGEIPKIVILSISNILLALVATVLALVSKLAIDSAQRAATASSNGEFLHYRNLIIFNCILILVVITSRLLLRVFTQSLTIRVQAKMEMKMRGRLFYSIMMKDYGKINKYHSGELMNRITSDVKIVTEGIISIVPDALYFLTQFVGAFVVLIIFDWKFTMLFIAAGIVMSVIAVFFRGKLKNLSKQVQETDGKVRSFFQEAIESMLVVKTFGLEKQFDKKGNILQRTNYEVKMRRRKITIFANAGFSFIFNSGYLFALGWCAIKVSMKAMTYGTLTAVLQLISQIQTPFVSITKMFPQYYAVLASAERIMEIENITNEESTYEKIDVKQTYDKLESIRFNNIKFNYGRETVIEHGDAMLNKGDFVAIRGISGIGKSTLMKMLLGVFKPQQGTIDICLENGKTIQASPDTRCMFSYVPQGNYLFSGTIRENILMINPNASDEEVSQALKLSEIEDFIENLPDGLDTVIGEKGLGISEGQAQRLAIARALISNAPIILLDEATSALDKNTEEKVLDNIKKLNKKTCIIITHKAAALEVCNREFIINDKQLTAVRKEAIN
jgi:ATP-binding cassette subfamily B protein